MDFKSQDLTDIDIITLEGCQAGLLRLQDLYALLRTKISGDKETLYTIIDDAVDIAIPILDSLRTIAQKDLSVGKSWALTKDILLFANKDSTVPGLKHNIVTGNISGSMARIKIIQQQIHDAQAFLSIVLESNRAY